MGYQVLSIEQDHIFPFVIEKYIKYEYEIVPWFAAMPREMFPRAGKEPGVAQAGDGAVVSLTGSSLAIRRGVLNPVGQ